MNTIATRQLLVSRTLEIDFRHGRKHKGFVAKDSSLSRMSLTIVTKAKKLFENTHLQRMKRHVIMADLASTRQLLVRMRFTNAAAAITTDEQGIDEMSEIKILTDSEIEGLCK
eukprot:scaffold31485_cov36-Attheya_sp.AAC.1